MGRLRLLWILIAVIAATLVSVGSAAGGTTRVCAPPGDDGTAGLTMGPTASGDFDGDGLEDAVALYYDAATWGLVTQVTLANGYKAFFENPDAQGPLASFFKIGDIDRDGDDEILVSVVPQSPLGPLDLYALAGCDLVKADGPSANGDPFELRAGPGTLFPYGLDCFAPAAGGKGMTQYVSYPDPQNYVDYTVVRTEYRLKVDDTAASATFKRTRETTTLLKANKANSAGLLNYASSVHCAGAPRCEGKRATIQGTPFKDKVVGTAGKDIVVSLGGADNIVTKGKSDVICAGGGNDTVMAGSGADSVFGQSGGDKLFGGLGADLLDGGPGNDTANGGPGKDTCRAENKTSC